MIVDAHTHVWPDGLAQRALSANRLPGLTTIGDGTAGSLASAMSTSGVDHSIALGIAGKAEHVDATNRFVASLAGQRFSAFGTVHVDLPVEANMDSLNAHGIRGVKIHPLFQGYGLEHPRLWELFEAFGSEIGVIVHVGAGGSGAVNALSTPRMLRRIVTTFPRLRLVACHFGGYHMLAEAEQELRGLDVVLETSWPPSVAEVDPSTARRVIARHGAERVVFGSDWPMADPAAEIAAIRRLGLSDEDQAGILGGNLNRVLRLGL